MGIYDIPAVIDHITNVTKQDTVFYVGHSMGTAMFWITMIHRPEYNSKIRLMSALAPVAYLSHVKSPIRIFAPLSTEAEVIQMLYKSNQASIYVSYKVLTFSPQLLVKLFGDHEFLPHQGVINILRKLVCKREFIGTAICENIVFLIAGFDRAQLNAVRDAVVSPLRLRFPLNAHTNIIFRQCCL
jgi:lysosomal acid lipase/cholesteryl ester hydrolase